MKKTLAYGIATAAVMASLGTGLGLASCARELTPEVLYGPPPSEEPSSSSGSEADSPVKGVHGSPVEVAGSGSAPDEGSTEDGKR